MATELKPCPFCGGEAALKKINTNTYLSYMPPYKQLSYSFQIQCLDCQVKTPVCCDKQATINVWNRRIGSNK